MNNRASFIEIVTATFAAGESRLFSLTGQYFELIDSTFPVDVTLSDVYGAQRGLMKAAEASFNLKNTEFGVIQITSASAQTIRFAYGTGEAGTRRAAGAVSIVGTVPVSGPLTDAQLRASLVGSFARPEAPTANFSSVGALAANAVLTVFLPAANINGAVLLAASMMDSSNAYHLQSFVAKNAAPGNPGDGDVMCINDYQGSVTGGTYSGGRLGIAQFIPAGLGLYFMTTAAGNALGARHARYKLL